jgi:hypothetical protein
VGAVAEALHALGGDPVALLLGRLGERRGELVAALDGEALQAEVVVVDPGGEEASHLLVFGPDGSVGRLRPDGTLAAGFRAHLTLRGAGTDILALVLGELDVARAVYRGLLDLHVPPDELAPRFPGLMRVLATALLDLAHQGSGRAGPGRP